MIYKHDVYRLGGLSSRVPQEPTTEPRMIAGTITCTATPKLSAICSQPLFRLVQHPVKIQVKAFPVKSWLTPTWSSNALDSRHESGGACWVGRIHVAWTLTRHPEPSHIMAGSLD